MELERGFIEKRDFSQARRGYDPDEVSRHLKAIAEAVEQLRQTQPQQPSLAGAAGSRVEAIIGAAEASAREIEEKARAEAEATRSDAERQAAARVSGAEEMVSALVASAQELQVEITDFVGRVSGLKTAVDHIRADFDAAVPERTSEALELDAGTVPEPDLTVAPLDLGGSDPGVDEPVSLEPPTELIQEPEPQVRDGGGDHGRASEGARLIALNMALSGTPREETARYLRENFDLDDQDELLDEVYARAGS